MPLPLLLIPNLSSLYLSKFLLVILLPFSLILPFLPLISTLLPFPFSHDQIFVTFYVSVYPVSISNYICFPPLHWRSCSAISLSPYISTLQLSQLFKMSSNLPVFPYNELCIKHVINIERITTSIVLHYIPFSYCGMDTVFSNNLICVS